LHLTPFFLKYRLNRGLPDDALFHMRQTRRLELDALVDEGGQLTATEIKSAATPSAAQYANLLRFRDQVTNNGAKQHSHAPKLRLTYGGDQASTHQGVEYVPWLGIGDLAW
jgi:hypothetical protein